MAPRDPVGWSWRAGPGQSGVAATPPAPSATERTVWAGQTVFPALPDSVPATFTGSGPRATVVLCAGAAYAAPCAWVPSPCTCRDRRGGPDRAAGAAAPALLRRRPRVLRRVYLVSCKRATSAGCVCPSTKALTTAKNWRRVMSRPSMLTAVSL